MRPMLAAQFEQDRVIRQLPCYIQPKLDGIRALYVNGQLLSRSLKQIPNSYVQDYFRNAARFCKDALSGLDGELIVGGATDPQAYHATNSGVMSQAGEPDFTFFAFDIVDPTTPYKIRLEHLHIRMRALQEAGYSRIKLLQTTLCTNLSEVYASEEVLTSQGYEGVILRSPVHRYKYGRATPKQGQLVKLKRFVDAEAQVVGFDELLHNANSAFMNELGLTAHTSHKANLRPANTLGALKCIGTFPDGTQYAVDLGTGFTAAQRQEIWDNREDYVGKWVKFKYLSTGTKEKPRHPTFLGFRDPADM